MQNNLKIASSHPLKRPLTTSSGVISLLTAIVFKVLFNIFIAGHHTYRLHIQSADKDCDNPNLVPAVTFIITNKVLSMNKPRSILVNSYSAIYKWFIVGVLLNHFLSGIPGVMILTSTPRRTAKHKAFLISSLMIK